MGRRWGQKNMEFKRFLDVPQRAGGVSFRVGVGCTVGGDPFPADAARRVGWEVADPKRVAADIDSYQQFIRSSRAEFSVAKHTYVQANTGWFSCRSACYLASGRPVITQDTGWSSHLPTGQGLFAFATIEEALEAIRRIEQAPSEHSRAARVIAEEEFDSNRVLGKMLGELGV
jgi:phosphoribosylamine-glycine ligase